MSRDALQVDELLSYAARVGSSIRVQLHLRDAGLEPGSATVQLRAGSRTSDAAAELTPTDTGMLVTFTASGVMGRRPWRMALHPSSGPRPMPVEARLLAAPDQPVALLLGIEPATAMTPPAPRSRVTAARRLARRLPEPVKRPLRRGRTLLARTRS